MSDYMIVAEEVMLARREGKPIVALESTVITHGLPYPENLALARNMEQTVRGQGAVPATIGVLEGVIYVGLRSEPIGVSGTGQGCLQDQRTRLCPGYHLEA